MGLLQTVTCKVDSSLSPILTTPVQSSLGTDNQTQQINKTNKLAPDSKICDTTNLRVLLSCGQIWMVNVFEVVIYFFFDVGVTYFNPNNVFEHSVKQKPFSSLETEVTVQDRTLVIWSNAGQFLAFFGLIIQGIMYTALKIKPGFYFSVCLIQIVVCLVLNVVIAAMAPIIMGIFLATCSWPLYCVGIWISLTVIWEHGNNKFDGKFISFGNEEDFLHLLKSINCVFSTRTVDEIQKLEHESNLEIDLKELKHNAVCLVSSKTAFTYLEAVV